MVRAGSSVEGSQRERRTAGEPVERRDSAARLHARQDYGDPGPNNRDISDSEEVGPPRANERRLRQAQEETPCTTNTGKPPSSTNLRRTPTALRQNIVKKGITQRQSGIRNDPWSILGSCLQACKGSPHQVRADSEHLI